MMEKLKTNQEKYKIQNKRAIQIMRTKLENIKLNKILRYKIEKTKLKFKKH
jgi:hypothetical protein